MGVFKAGFVVAGAQKGGTTSLYAYLRQHPEIGMADQKELHFFDRSITRLDPLVGYARYHRHFKTKPGATIYGEVTPLYLYWPAAMKKLWQYNPKLKLIAMLRNPIERAFSHWRMEYMRWKDPLSFSEAIRKERDRAREALPRRHPIFSYVDRGFYSEQIRRVYRFFPAEQVLFLKSEQFFADPIATMRRITDFLGVKPFQFDTGKIHNEGRAVGQITQEDREYLGQIFRKDIEAVEQMLSWDCSDWTAPPATEVTPAAPPQLSGDVNLSALPNPALSQSPIQGHPAL